MIGENKKMILGLDIGYVILSGMFISCLIAGAYEYKKVNDWDKVEPIIMLVLCFLSWVGCGVQLILWKMYPPTKF
jgi:hypothetical protein